MFQLSVTMIRPFQSDDTFSVIKLAYETLTERYTPTLFNYFYETFPQGFLVAEHHHRLIGFVIALPVTNTLGKILMLSVQASYRRKKIGSTLLAQSREVLCKQQIQRIELEVNPKNTAAVQFYKSHGFTIQQTLSEFYENKDDAYLMSCHC